MSTAERVYKLVLVLVGAGLLATHRPDLQAVGLEAFVVVSAAAFFLNFVWVDVSVGASKKVYYLWDIALFGSIFLNHPTGATMWAMFSGTFLFALYKVLHAIFVERRRVQAERVLMAFSNPFIVALYVPIVHYVYHTVSGGHPLLSSGRSALAILATSAAFMLVDTALGSVQVTLGQGYSLRRLMDTWRDMYAGIALYLAMLAPLGAAFALFYTNRSPATVLLILPALIMQLTMLSRRSMIADMEEAIEVMMGVLEERDQYTFGHSERVSLYAAALAEEMALPPDQVEQIRKAGRIHDIGKIDVPDAVLRKPAGLTEEEFQKMKSHTHRNYGYLEKYTRLGRHIPFELAAYHHERWDGRGYIYGLKGDEIPLGSRIISVADTYDAMTSDRPYRKALPTEEAVRRLQAAAGSQFDPDVVEAFVRMHHNGRVDDINRQWKEREMARTEAKKV